MKPPYHHQTKFRIENPTKQRKAFRIRFIEPGSGWRTLRLPEIDKANELMLEGTVSPAYTKTKLKAIMATQYALRDKYRPKPPTMSENLKILEAMWTERYNRRKLRTMKRPKSARQDLERAVEAAGPHPLDTCSLDDLADHLDATLGDRPEIHRRRITWINSILLWLGRKTIPSLSQMGRKKVTYLSEDEFRRVIEDIKNPAFRLLCEIGFYTGMRLGEIFYLQPRHVREDHLWVEKQMLAERDAAGHYKIGSTKTNVERVVLLVEAVRTQVVAWAAIPLEEREKWRNHGLSKAVQKASRAAFPTDKTKHCHFHALRHSNAIWLLQRGASMHEVAQHLGNHFQVTERYYSGFELKKESISRLKKMLDAG